MTKIQGVYGKGRYDGIIIGALGMISLFTIFQLIKKSNQEKELYL